MKNKLHCTSLVMLGLALAVSSCHKHEEVDPNDPLEYKYVRLLVSDEKTTDLSVVNPRTGLITTE